MQTAESVLIIILAVTLSLFLLAGFFVFLMLLKLLKSVRRIVERAEQVVETAGDAAEMLRNASGPLAVFKVIRNIVRAVEKSRK